MDDNDYKALLAEYEKLNMDRPDMYPLTFEEYTDGLVSSFSNPKYMDAPIEKQVKLALLFMNQGRPLMKYYNAFKAQDMVLLNNALFETAHLMQISNISATGTDHGFYGMNITPNLLAAFCKAYMKCKEFGMNGFSRRFCVEAHGLYNLAIWAYDGELREHIAMPQVSNFCQELTLYQEEIGYSAGRIVHVYPESMDICNRLMYCEPPRMFLTNEGKMRKIDVERFAQDIAGKI